MRDYWNYINQLFENLERNIYLIRLFLTQNNQQKMKNLLKISTLALALFVCTFNMQAQSFGYVDSQVILSELPAVKQAESNLEALQQQLQKKFEASVQQLQKDYGDLQQRVERGELSPVEQETQGAAIQARQQALQQEEQGMVQQIQDKRNELLQPIYDGLNAAIADVAKEKGFTFIFDKQILLYGEESQDVSADVRTKLNM